MSRQYKKLFLMVSSDFSECAKKLKIVGRFCIRVSGACRKICSCASSVALVGLLNFPAGPDFMWWNYIMSSDFDQKQDAYWADKANLRPYDHPVVEAFATQRVEFLKSIFREWHPENALDVGCGDGFGMMYMNALVPHIHGCDRSPTMLKENPASPEFLTQCDANELAWNDNSFDLVYCWELLHHIGDPVKVVNEMRRVARKTVLLCEPNCLNPAMAAFGMIIPEERGLLRFTPGYTHKLLIKSGLVNVRSFTVSYFTPNRTPLWLVNLLRHFPYRVPVFGLYTISIGDKI